MDKKGIVFYDNWLKFAQGMSDEQAGKMLKSIAEQRLTGNHKSTGDTLLDAILATIFDKMAEDDAHYQDVCRKRSEARKSKQVLASDSKSKQMSTNDDKCQQMITNDDKCQQKALDTDTDTDTETDTDTDIYINKGTRTRKKSDKLVFGEYKHVRLTIEQYDKLAVDLGEQMRDACIKRLDEYIQERPDYKSKDHNLCIRRWVVKAVREEEQKQPVIKQTTFHQFDMKHNYDYDAMEQELLRRE